MRFSCFGKKKRPPPAATPLTQIANGRPKEPSPPPATLPQQTVNVAPKDSQPSERWRTAKNTLMIALDLAEGFAEGLPIPGVKGAIGGILSIIKNIDVSSQYC